MKRKRDSQRTKFWKALQIVLKAHPETEMSLDDVTAFITKVTQSAWFLRRHPAITTIIKDGRARRSYGWIPRGRSTWEYRVPVFARKKPILLQLISHSVIPEDASWHGREFAKTYLELLERWAGESQAETARKAFVELRVRHKNKRRSALEIVQQRLGMR